MDTASREFESESSALDRVRGEIRRVIVGQEDLVDRLLLGLVCGGHVLIEGVPGLAKTLVVSTLAGALDASFQRIQFTPDLLPGDLIGTLIYNQKTGEFTPHKGPIFSQMVLADEINRAPAKVQSALLEAMQERQVTIGDETYALDEPFMVLATQNPIEQEGTYPLPEAQMDRFLFKLVVQYPSMDDEQEIMRRMSKSAPELTVSQALTTSELLEIRRRLDDVHLADELERYILKLVDATRQPDVYGLSIGHYLRHGASPRASIFLALAAKGVALFDGRDFVRPEDIKAVAHDVMRHRISLGYKAEADGQTPDTLLDQVLSAIEV